MALRGGSRGHAVLPRVSSRDGSAETNARRGRIEAHFKAIAAKHKIRLQIIVADVADKVIRDLEHLTPKDTGAAAGTTVGARRPMYKWHPAAQEGRSIGHNLGQSGWQVIKMDNAKKIAIVNPMWEPYLKEVNYLYDNFVETAHRQMQEYIKYLLSDRA